MTNSLGLDCRQLPSLIWVCGGMRGMKAGEGLTIGDVILAGDSTSTVLTQKNYIKHESQHAFQWARDGFTGFVFNWSAMTVMSMTLTGPSYFDIGGGGCMNLFEVEAKAFVGSGYWDCSWDPEHRL